MEAISFPGMGLEFMVRRVAFYVPGLGIPIFWYGLLIAIGLLGGILYFFSRAKEFAVDPDRASDVLIVAIICAIIGSRLYYAAFSPSEFPSFLDLFNLRMGGLAIYGCIIGSIAAAVVMCKIRKIKFLPLMDLGSGGLLIGQAIGRWGNFANHEAFGSNTTAPWGMTSASISAYLSNNRSALSQLGVTVEPSVPVHPTFLYESLWCAAGFALLFWLTKRRRFDGQLTLVYLGWYGLGRFFIEGLRTDSLLVGSLRVSQMLAMVCMIASAAALFTILSKIRREGDPEYLMLYRDTEEGKLVIAGEFYPKKGKAGDVPETVEAAEEASGPPEEENDGDVPLEDTEDMAAGGDEGNEAAEPSTQDGEDNPANNVEEDEDGAVN